MALLQGRSLWAGQGLSDFPGLQYSLEAAPNQRGHRRCCGKTRGGGQPAGECLGWVRPSLPMVWRRGFCSPGPPPWQSLERWSPAHLPLAPASLGPNGPPALVPSPQLARLDPAPSTLVLTVPGPLPRCSAVAPPAPSLPPRLAGNTVQMLGQWPVGAGGEEVAGGCPPGE